MAKNTAIQKMDQISLRVQQGLDSLFIPRGIMKSLSEIKELQKQEKVTFPIMEDVQIYKTRRSL